MFPGFRITISGASVSAATGVAVGRIVGVGVGGLGVAVGRIVGVGVGGLGVAVGRGVTFAVGVGFCVMVVGDTVVTVGDGRIKFRVNGLLYIV